MAPSFLSKLAPSRLGRSKSSSQLPATTSKDGEVASQQSIPIRSVGSSKPHLGITDGGVDRRKSQESFSTTNSLPFECTKIWKDAFDRLDKRDCQWERYCEIVEQEGIWPIGSVRTVNSVEDVITVVDEVRSASVKKGQSRLRRTTAAVLDGLERISGIVSAAVSTNPFAAAGWGVVSFLVKTANNDQALQELCWSTSDTLGDMLYRYQTYATVYLQPGSTPSADMADALIDLFVKVLEFEIAVVVTVRSKFERLKAAVYGSDMEIITQEIARQEQVVEKLHSILARQADSLRYEDIKKISGQLMASTLEIAEQLRQIDAKITAMKIQIDSEYRLSILDWISPIGYDKIHGAKIPMHESADWLIKGSRYERWLSAPTASTFWLYGLMGSGKSCVVHAVVEDIKARLKLLKVKSIQQSLMYYYCSSADVEGKLETDIVDAVFRSLLKQIADTNETETLHPLILETYKNQRPKGPLTASQCANLIPRLTILASRIYLVLDGLDECPVAAQRDLLARVRRLVQHCATIQVFVASRKEQAIQDGLEELRPIAVNIAAQNEGSIFRVVDEKVDAAASTTHQSLYSRNGESQTHKVRETLKKHAGGMFRWVEAAMSFLHESSTFSEMADRLEKLPVCEDLYVLYDEIYNKNVQKARKSGNEIVMRITILMMLYGQHLHKKGGPFWTDNIIAEACHFAKAGRLSSQLTAADLCEYCVGLFILQDSGRLSIAHASVREYLSSRHAIFAFEHGHAQLAALCMNVFRETEERYNKQVGFKLYASANWLTHLRQLTHITELHSLQMFSVPKQRLDVSSTLKSFLLTDTAPPGFTAWNEWAIEMHNQTSDWNFDSSRLLTEPPSTFLARVILDTRWKDPAFQSAKLLTAKPLDPWKRYLSSVMDFVVRARAAPAIAWLVEQGIDVNITDEFGNTPCHLLLEPDSMFIAETLRFRPTCSTLETLTTLINLGADMHRANEFGAIPPVVASFDRVARIGDSADALGVFLANGLSTTFESKEGIAKDRSLVDEIYEHTKDLKIKAEIEASVEPLLLRYALERNEINELLTHAAKAGCLDLILKILDACADADLIIEKPLAPLEAALCRASIRVGRDIGVEAGEPRMTGATIAVLSRLCVQLGADLSSITRKEYTYSTMERRQGTQNKVTALKVYQWRTAYFYAVVCHCDLDTIKLWASYGATPDLQCSEQGSVMDFARDMARCQQKRPASEPFSHIPSYTSGKEVTIGTWTEIVEFLEGLPGAHPEITVELADDEDWFYEKPIHHDPKIARSYTRGQKDIPVWMTDYNNGST